MVRKVFDDNGAPRGETHVVSESSRSQIRLWIVRDVGRVKEIRIQRVPGNPASDIQDILTLKEDQAAKLISLIRAIEHVPPTGGDTERLDDNFLESLLSSPDSLTALYHRNPKVFRGLITNDSAARDVIALSRRREQVAHFKALLDDAEYFDHQTAITPSKRPEAVWQRFFEDNPWILGVSLTAQLLTSWDSSRLEQVVAGYSPINKGKRVDALLETSGAISSLVFAEFKTHRTELLGKEHRAGCWAPSEYLSAGIAQVHGTVHRAMHDFNDYVQKLASDGSVIPGGYSYLLRPRSFLLIGRLEELHGEQGGDHMDKIRSFELFRRHVQEPEIVTFDELLARAEWNISAAKADVGRQR